MLTTWFTPQGTFDGRTIFRFNQITKGNFQSRLKVLQALATATVQDVADLTPDARLRVVQFLRQEAGRYYGTARRAYPGRNGEAVGTLLPRLQFESPRAAAWYARVLHQAGKNFLRHAKRLRNDYQGPAERPGAGTPAGRSTQLAARERAG